MKINTKVVFEWSPKFKQYEEVYCDSYEHDGEVAECQYQSGGQPVGLKACQVLEDKNLVLVEEVDIRLHFPKGEEVGEELLML